MSVFLGPNNTIFKVDYDTFHDKSEFWNTVIKLKFGVQNNYSQNAIDALKTEIDNIYEDYNSSHKTKS